MKKWILRFLFIILFLIAGAFLFLNIISGEGESQRRGLEGAFAQVFQGDAKIAKLNNFNILPQFIVNTENIAVNRKDGNFTAEKIVVAFSFWDLMTKVGRVEELNFTKVNIDKNIIGAYQVKLNKVEIDKTQSKLVIDGEINSQKINAQIDLKMFNAARPSFGLGESNNFVLNIGDIKTIGTIIPYRSDIDIFNNVSFSAFGKTCSLGSVADNTFFKVLIERQIDKIAMHDFDVLCNNIKNGISAK